VEDHPRRRVTDGPRPRAVVSGVAGFLGSHLADRLVARGWVSSEWRQSENNRSARYYTLTSAGRQQLAAERAQWEKLSRGVDLILSGAGA